MSNLEADREIAEPAGVCDLVPTLERLEPRIVFLGPRQEVRRVLPNKERRLIGAWCFVDHYGPENITNEVGMRVPPHPHSGLQTVSWLLDGEISHRDSLGSDAVVVPGQLNVMTSGPGIAHSEESPPGHSAIMHGVQLWVALPDEARQVAPRDFTQYSDLPVMERAGLRATVVMGEFEGAVSPATSYTPIVGVELGVTGPVDLTLRPDFEYDVLALDAGVVVDGQQLALSEIAYVGRARETLAIGIASGEPVRALLLGGEPFAEELVMWWNFIGRSHDEIVQFRRIWNDGGEQFGEVIGYDGDRLVAPPMPNTRLKARPRHR
ncbi:MAG: pirin family protein [Nocardioidaceae bacterium]